MKSFFRIFYKFRGWWLERQAEIEIRKLKDGEYRLPYKIPYISQYASAERAEEFVKHEELLKMDAQWCESGADSPEDYAFWAPKLCGMACFKMILLSLGCRTPKLVELGKQAMAAGCYLPDPKNPKRLIGLLHKPFLKFAENFGFHGKLIWHICPCAIASEILKNNFIIASVHHDMRYAGARHDSKQGHLVFVHGFKIDGGKVAGFYIHNPSGFFGISQENHFVPVDDFLNCFSGRIIVLWKK
ncbi:hypothetical protein A3G55_02630 [Candidatus Giovannonibacteria bacterium RIFCSPLOWO2_12_FULL_44_25]|uniref:Peptidase C39-like domain-containing protein n=3 Tax=Candidatus Giovannoniibacteriota TaxID=1752738 RepID=A0A0G1ICU5_9BACT|nr:MAG: hypothetical protein UW15_C0015G0011 [Parcubacteria group bacterium GW2011_GWC1_44_10]KKT57045.1 MAG: hypothetical protein UW49_C0008G0007 [Candidatus Giovannonibacteria bacterium GW2011_GWB1_44_23]KKT59482.1 MAG: hypothetical protein UW53_C0011G0011 [Candidatus Giovannonibacteria bacterium GW2011_GWA1_44_25]OGF49932.1 MAG: hypothetical protein A2120_04455 [Candidatus Giovannonibacteria bacterium GWA2_45_15]OGF60566.1 MAG: hypothetical protein A2656_00615 [Candidatus Giovannonibacteria 